MRIDRIGIAALVAVVALCSTSCGGDRDPVRVGVLTDCVGLLSVTRDLVLAGSALPLLERGGLRHGDVVTGDIAGRRVELLPACTEFTYLHLLILETRRLVENEGVDVVLGPIGGPENVVFRDLAARFPDVTFIAVDSGAQAAALQDPPPNLFRFAPSGPELTAGLGSYAYRDLGWRRAVVVAENWYAGWEPAAGFVAEFCALGGSVVERDFASLFAPDPAPAARRHAASSDGVLVVSMSGTHAPYLGAYVRAARPAARRLLLSGPVFLDRANLRGGPGLDLSGVVLGSFVPLQSAGAVMLDYRASFARRFPDMQAWAVDSPATLTSYTAVEALLTALEETGAALDDGQQRLRSELTSNVIDAPQGTVRLDPERRVSASIHLQRVERGGGGRVRLDRVRTLDGVEPTYGGIFTARTPSPSRRDPTCERRPPPRWAR